MPARRNAAGMSCSLSPNIADIDIGRPSSVASDWSTTWLMVVSCWTRRRPGKRGDAPEVAGLGPEQVEVLGVEADHLVDQATEHRVPRRAPARRPTRDVEGEAHADAPAQAPPAARRSSRSRGHRCRPTSTASTIWGTSCRIRMAWAWTVTGWAGSGEPWTKGTAPSHTSTESRCSRLSCRPRRCRRTRSRRPDARRTSSWPAPWSTGRPRRWPGSRREGGSFAGEHDRPTEVRLDQVPRWRRRSRWGRPSSRRGLRRGVPSPRWA